MDRLKTFLLLNLVIMLYSTSSIFSKTASKYSFKDYRFIIFYGMMILVLGIYAILWQQIIKRVPLSFAYANKAFTVIWGMIWGYIFFSENITPGKVMGALIVLCGVILFSTEESDKGYE